MRQAKVRAHALKAYKALNGKVTARQQARFDRMSFEERDIYDEKQIQDAISALEELLRELGISHENWP